MAKRKSRKNAAAAKDIKDADHDRKLKTNQFPTRLQKRRDKGDLRKEMFNRKKGEEELSKGMTIRNIFLQAQGFDVKEDEDKSEKYEFDAYKHAKKVQNGELTYPSRAASVGRGSVSSHHPVRAMMRKFTRKTITKVIAVLEEERQIEVVSKQVDKFFQMSFSRNDPATRRAKSRMLEIMGKEYKPIVQSEKLCFLHPPRQNIAVTSSKDRASPRAKAILHSSLGQKS
jgi:hypothetical protein